MESHQLEELISELQNGDVHQRRAATSKLSKSQDVVAVPWLIKAYDDADSIVRFRAIEGLNVIGSKEALDFLTSKGITVRDPFLLRRSRYMKAGAWAGLVGVEIGLLAGGLFMISFVDPGYIYLIIAFVCVYPYALIGVAAGALIARLSIKRDNNPRNNSAIFRNGIIKSGIGGLASGILLYVFLWVTNYLFY